MNALKRYRRRGKINGSMIGVVLLIGTVLASLGLVIKNIRDIEHPTKTTIRICHWQLEAGYRDAMNAVIAEYEKLHPDIQIVQMPVTEKVYTQWINTQLISGTAPDLCEMGKSNLIDKDEYTVQFFVPLGEEVVKPNPYNAGTALEGAMWKETFRDGMRGGFRDTLQDYYSVPTTSISMRMFCNVDLIKTVTGSAQVPKSLGQLIKVCEQVRKYSFETPGIGGRIIPIVSCYGSPAVTNPYLVPFTAKLESELDLDLDGQCSTIESYRGIITGVAGSNSPVIQAYWMAMKQLCDQMQQGFSQMDRQQAQFQFSNGNAAFMATGSWDAAGTYLGAKSQGFAIELADWPLPGPGEPYYEFIAGRANEAASRGAGPYGLYRSSAHKEEALDFLRFLTSVKGNEMLNDLSGWPPIVLGSQPSEKMLPFMPNPDGFTSSLKMGIGSRVGSVLEAESVAYLQGEKSLDAFLSVYDKSLTAPRSDSDWRSDGDWACWKDFDQRWRDCRNQERLLTRDEAIELMQPNAYSADRYRRTVLQQLRRNNGADYQYLFKLFRGKPLPTF